MAGDHGLAGLPIARDVVHEDGAVCRGVFLRLGGGDGGFVAVLGEIAEDGPVDPAQQCRHRIQDEAVLARQVHRRQRVQCHGAGVPGVPFHDGLDELSGPVVQRDVVRV